MYRVPIEYFVLNRDGFCAALSARRPDNRYPGPAPSASPVLILCPRSRLWAERYPKTKKAPSASLLTAPAVSYIRIKDRPHLPRLGFRNGKPAGAASAQRDKRPIGSPYPP